MKYSLLVVFVFGVMTGIAQNGNSAFAFTQIPISVVSAALGGSQVATWRGDVNQVSDNPAFIDSSLHQSVSLNYLNYLTTINQASIAYSRMFDSIGFGSMYLRYFDYGTFQGYDESGNDLGEFKVVDYEVGISFGRKLNDHINYGATLKNVFSSMYQSFAYGAALDLGGYYQSTNGNFTAGLTIDNLGLEIIDYSGGERNFFPASINAAISKKFDKAPIMFGLQYSNIQTWDLAGVDGDVLANPTIDPLTGEESRPAVTLDNFARHLSASVALIPSDNFNLMLGYNFRRRLELATSERPGFVGFSFGANIKIKRFGIQYAITNYHLSGTSNHFGITTNLNEWYSKKSLN